MLVNDGTKQRKFNKKTEKCPVGWPPPRGKFLSIKK